jgi:thiol-disulfide isomerase/thioredoxin
MKQLLFISLVLLSACAREEGRVVNDPEFDGGDAIEWLQFSKIVLGGDATVVHAEVYNRPGYWVRIPSRSLLKGGSGRLYRLLRCKGMELDRQVTMPGSGNLSIVLRFEAIPGDESVVDFLENEEDTGDALYGIRLHAVEHDEHVRCTLRGEVIDRPGSSRLILARMGTDFRTSPVTYISIRDGKFEHLLHAGAEEAYELVFVDEYQQGSWRAVPFIAEQGEVRFTLRPEESVVQGGKYNDEYLRVKKEIHDRADTLYRILNARQEAMEAAGNFFTPGATALRVVIDHPDTPDSTRHEAHEKFIKLMEEENYLSPAGKALKEESGRVYDEGIEKKLRYARENPGIVGYALLVESTRQTIEQRGRDGAAAFEVFRDSYRSRFPDHPYTAVMESYLNTASVKVGLPCIDITATDEEGREARVAGLIRGKVALIHLWASWCGPCRRHGKEMIPLYERYKERGFTVIGIARERDARAMSAAVKQDRYPWVNLLELDDRHEIWRQFGIGNAGGGEFLVDEKGNFLAVKTSPGEVERILHELYD